MKSIVTLIILIFSYLSTFAGIRDVGNGGEVIVCRDAKNNIISAEVLDSFESRTLRGHNVSLGAPGVSVEEKVLVALGRDAALDSPRAARYIKWYRHFDAGITWRDTPLPATPDVDPSLIPKGCNIEQIAIQRNTAKNIVWYEYGPAVTINTALWSALDNDQKAVLILHEIFYHEALFSELISAEPIRYLNSLYFADMIQDSAKTPLAYAELLHSLGYKTIYFKGINFFHPAEFLNDDVPIKDWKSEAFYPDTGFLKKLSLIKFSDYQTQSEQTITVLGAEIWIGGNFDFNEVLDIVEFENTRQGFFSTIYIVNPAIFKLPGAAAVHCKAGRLYLEHGAFKDCNLN
ncbi:MAG: hypothetical protein H7328_12225 [Bdellovibrio sp.]|nr:hypothetical protein [Bdellovibrio sp.]